MGEAIKLYNRENHELLIGETTAKKIKKNVGSASLPFENNEGGMIIKGRDLVSGMPKKCIYQNIKLQRKNLKLFNILANPSGETLFNNIDDFLETSTQ